MFEVCAYSRSARAAAVALQGLAVLNVAYLIVNVALDISDGLQRAPLPAVVVGLIVFSGVPWLLVTLLNRVLRATVQLEATHLTLTLRTSRIAIPLASIASVRPFVVPLPVAGLVLHLQSGARFRYALGTETPGALLSALHGGGAASDAASVRYADAKHAPTRKIVWIVKWGLYPIAIAVIFFRLDQYIRFGGAFGQYQMYGLGPYLQSFALYYGGTSAGLVLWASLVRLTIEPLVFAATWIARASAAPLVRRIAELLCFFLYFVCVPALVAFRLLL